MNRRALLLGTTGLCALLMGCASGSDTAEGSTASTGTETETAPPTTTGTSRRPRLVGRSFTPVHADACSTDDGALVSETETGVSVVGCVTRATDCSIARLARADYDVAPGTATLVVKTIEQTNTKDCTESPVIRDYEATLRFESGPPGRVVVVYDDAGSRREVARIDMDARGVQRSKSEAAATPVMSLDSRGRFDGPIRRKATLKRRPSLFVHSMSTTLGLSRRARFVPGGGA